jgi:hypothetical protein
MRGSLKWFAGIGVAAALGAGVTLKGAGAVQGAANSCNELLPAPRQAKGEKVGPTTCRMQQVEATIGGRAYTRIDIGLDGTVEGYVSKTGSLRGYLTNAPDLAFPQSADPGPIFYAVASYEGAKGASMTVIFPKAPGAWNGKMWVTAHGAGMSFRDGKGNLRPWDKNLDPANPGAGLNGVEEVMLSKGYAVVKTRRSTPQSPAPRAATPGVQGEPQGEISAKLEDGSTISYASFNETARYVMDFTLVAKNVVAKQLGRAPSRTYLTGHSAGARVARTINYTPGLNKVDGRPVFDGFLPIDSATGLWLPVLLKNGKDVLFATDAERAEFVPQIDVTHQMYNRVTHSATSDPTWPPKRPDWVGASYLASKRENARLLRDKGLAAKHRMYEVRSVSHSGGGAGIQHEWLMDGYMDLLDAWVDKNVLPPPTRSDWAPLGDVNNDGTTELGAIALPQVACPLGVYHLPTPGSGSIALAAFTGNGMEPLEPGPGNQAFVDMNRNGVWDQRETVEQAWTRLGLLKKGETLTRDNYVACTQAAVEALRKDGFISEKNGAAFIAQAKTADLQPKQAPPVTGSPRSGGGQ